MPQQCIVIGAPAEMFLAKARELNQQASQFQKIAIGHESLSGNSLEQQPADWPSNIERDLTPNGGMYGLGNRSYADGNKEVIHL